MVEIGFYSYYYYRWCDLTYSIKSKSKPCHRPCLIREFFTVDNDVKSSRLRSLEFNWLKSKVGPGLWSCIKMV